MADKNQVSAGVSNEIRPPNAAEPQRVIRAFHRQFMMVRKIRNRLPVESVSFQINIKNGMTSTNTSIPDENKHNELAVVMRPLLDRKSEINIWSVWEELQRALDPTTLQNLTPKIERTLERLKKGVIEIKSDGVFLDHHMIYETVARGAFFDEEACAARCLEGHQTARWGE